MSLNTDILETRKRDKKTAMLKINFKGIFINKRIQRKITYGYIGYDLFMP